MFNPGTLLRHGLLLTLIPLIVACSGGESSSKAASSSKDAGGGDSGGGGSEGSTNSAPSITQSCNATINEQAPYSCSPSVVDSDAGDTHTWSMDTGTNTCSWLSIDSTTGTISGQATSVDLGNCTLAFKVSDGVVSSSVSSVGITVSAMAFAPKAYIKAANNKGAQFLGAEVAISGDTLVAGARDEPSGATTITNGSSSPNNYDALQSGAAFVYARVNGDWIQSATLKAPNSVNGLKFGEGGLDIDSDTIVVSAFREDSDQTTITNGSTAPTDTNLPNSGAVYVFRKINNLWTNEAYIKAPNSGDDDRFGKKIAISGDILAVGAHQEDNSQTTITNGGNITESSTIDDSGAVYIFKRTGSNWSFESYIKSSISDVGDKFGEKLALDNDTLVVGVSQDDSTQTAIVNGGTITDDNGAFNVGAAHVFRRATNGTWSFEAYLKAPNAGNSDFFGDSVAIDADTIVVGSTWESNSQSTVTNGGMINESSQISNSGAAYVYARTGSTWSFQSYLKAPNVNNNDEFGMSVSVSGDLIVVGTGKESSDSDITLNNGTAAVDEDAIDAGAAYVFARTGVDWEFKSYLKAPNSAASQYFAESLAVDQGTIAVGAPGEAGNQNFISNDGTASNDQSVGNSGAVYVFDQN